MALLVLQGCAIPIIGAPPEIPEAQSERLDHGPVTRGQLGGTSSWAGSPAGAAGSGSSRAAGNLHALSSMRVAESDNCRDLLRQKKVAFDPVTETGASGVTEPIVLRGPIGGVEVAAAGGSELHSILDCRLALRLLHWAPALRRAGVQRIEHFSIYRPGARTPRKGKVSGHARGLALDAARFILDDGVVLDVEVDWEDRQRGQAPCPSRPHEGRGSRILRALVCDAVAMNLFQVVITPHHDRAHSNHVHLELKPEVDWTYVR